MPSASQDSTLDAAIAALVGGFHRDPFALLGPHQEEGAVYIRASQPAARHMDVRVIATGELVPMIRRDAGGLYEARLEGSVRDYRLRITYPGDHIVELDDPYRYGR